MVFFAVKIFFFASKPSRIFILRHIIFFLQKQYFLRPKEQTEYFFLPMSETEFFFSIKFAARKLFSPKNHSPPPFKLNGCSLMYMTPVHHVQASMYRKCLNQSQNPKGMMLMTPQLIISVKFITDNNEYAP